MSKPTPLTPEQKEAYWLSRIAQKHNSVFPAFIRELGEIVDMANHGLTNDSKIKVRNMIAERLGRVLLGIETDEHRQKTTRQPTSKAATSPKSAGSGDIAANLPTTEDQDNQEHLRSSVLPDAGGADDPREVLPSPTEQG